MKKTRTLLLILFVIFTLAGVGLLMFNFLVPKASGLLLETSPAATVFINGEEVGRTPYTSLRKSGEITLRLIPDSFGKPLTPYEEKVNLVQGVETVVRRYFGNTDNLTEGEVLSFEKLSSNKSGGLTILTSPENVQIEINGVSKGTSPYTTTNIESGTSRIKFTANSYKDREIEVSLIKGYKLICYVKLAQIDTQKTSVVPNPKEELSEKFVKILKTPTGFLRVRDEASTSAKEIGQVRPGEEYKYLSEDSNRDWYKLVFKEDVEGWVTSQYSQVVTKSTESTGSAKTR